jgi:hypothetical protein
VHEFEDRLAKLESADLKRSGKASNDAPININADEKADA